MKPLHDILPEVMTALASRRKDNMAHNHTTPDLFLDNVTRDVDRLMKKHDHTYFDAAACTIMGYFRSLKVYTEEQLAFKQYTITDSLGDKLFFYLPDIAADAYNTYRHDVKSKKPGVIFPDIDPHTSLLYKLAVCKVLGYIEYIETVQKRFVPIEDYTLVKTMSADELIGVN